MYVWCVQEEEEIAAAIPTMDKRFRVTWRLDSWTNHSMILMYVCIHIPYYHIHTYIHSLYKLYIYIDTPRLPSRPSTTKLCTYIHTYIVGFSPIQVYIHSSKRHPRILVAYFHWSLSDRRLGIYSLSFALESVCAVAPCAVTNTHSAISELYIHKFIF